MTGEIETRGGRRLFAASVVLSGIGVALVAWWAVSDPRPWWMLVAGLLAALAGVVLGARGRRDAAAELGIDPPERGGR